jgi:hypothetical protein
VSDKVWRPDHDKLVTTAKLGYVISDKYCQCGHPMWVHYHLPQPNVLKCDVVKCDCEVDCDISQDD